MKELGLVLLFIVGMNFTSCASKRPPVWYDEYGILHRENVTPDEIQYVKVILYKQELYAGCKRLRNIYLTGTSMKEWELKTAAAKQGATHVLKSYINNLNDTMGIAFDCNGAAKRNTLRRMQKTAMRNALMSEIERRTYAKGNNKVTPKLNIPVLKYND